MNTLVIATCVKEKREGKHKAKDLYNSDLFKKMRNYIESKGYDWKIISAKHGLIDPEQEIESYDEQVFDQFQLSKQTIVATTKYLLKETIRTQLSPIIERYDRIILMCGKHYRDVLLSLLKYRMKSGLTEVISFFEGTKGIGEIKQKLKAEFLMYESCSRN